MPPHKATKAALNELWNKAKDGDETLARSKMMPKWLVKIFHQVVNNSVPVSKSHQRFGQVWLLVASLMSTLLRLCLKTCLWTTT